jgi:hypothetical protein
MKYASGEWRREMPRKRCKEGEEERKGRRGMHGCMARGGHGLLQVSLGPTMPYPSTPCRRPPLWIPHDVSLRGRREGKGEKRKRKKKAGGERMGIWQGVAMDYFK